MSWLRISRRASASTAALLVAAAPPARSARAQGAAPAAPDALLARVATAYRRARTVDITFEQTLTNPLTGNTSTARGELLRRQPNLLAIRFDAPASDRIVADGHSLWMYLPSSAPGQVMKMPAAAAGSLPLDPMGQLLTSPTNRYRVEDGGVAMIGGQPARVLNLTPTTSPALFTRARLWVDERTAAVRQIEATEQSGLVRRITLLSLRTNVSLPRSAFRFTPPAGVRVVDRRALFGG